MSASRRRPTQAKKPPPVVEEEEDEVAAVEQPPPPATPVQAAAEIVEDADANTFKILVATDNHIGYLEKDPIRGNDSFETFEEILKLAQEQAVDFILLGGDLFHDNKPSRKCMHKTMTLLRKYCMGDRPCPVEFLSDSKENFSNGFGTVNYEDPNYNVGMPIFSIHGNHDDPSGDGSLCALDLLSAAGLVNYFGKQVEVDDITIKPILLRKGESKLALYGLGNVRDERLNRTFQKKKVKMFRPSEGTEDWFNMLVIHQNRVAHGPNNYIPENFLDDFLQLILWGHEHECLVHPVQNSAQDFYITQPGSSVATSLCEGEAVPKHVAILRISGSDFNLEPVRLRTVRPFIMDDVVLQDIEDLRPKDEKMVNQFLQERVEHNIDSALQDWLELNPDVPEKDWPKPLVRLKVEYSGGFTTFNPQRFGQLYVNRVANPKDILHFYRKRAQTGGAGKKKEAINMDAFLPERLENFRVEDLVAEYLTAQNLDILPENELGDAVRMFVEKDDKDAIKDFVRESLVRTQTYLKGTSNTEDDDKIKDEIEREKKARFDQFAAESAERRNKPEMLSATRSGRPAASRRNDDDDMDVVEDSLEEDEVPTTRKPAAKRGAATRGRGGKRGASTAAKGKGRGKAATVIEDTDDDPIVDEDPLPSSSKPTTAKRKLPGSMASTNTGRAPKRAAVAAPAAASSSTRTRQTRLAFGGSQQQPIVLDGDDDDL
ncbi:DNA repair protein rad32 [Fimicolochytrium jonesii]|uniref:DNA repair protein rad32 n=1 Tax=Fimicolochytrium jonesii TaxID=1396493 RepID=UPI0022FEA6A4|nr:DNA repair protein rad32 [Fimicolochytrium jonesii]KAI8818933.1 DNA repair protein rad32 [Fimicolochytrium jonesii]